MNFRNAFANAISVGIFFLLSSYLGLWPPHATWEEFMVQLMVGVASVILGFGIFYFTE